MTRLDHLLGCQSCGLFGRLRRRRARAAAVIADAGLAAFFARLGDDIRSNRPRPPTGVKIVDCHVGWSRVSLP